MEKFRGILAKCFAYTTSDPPPAAARFSELVYIKLTGRGDRWDNLV